MTGWLKAGLIGAVIVVALKVLQQLPCVACCAVPLEWAAYGCSGARAAYWIVSGRTMGSGAGQGALAALIAAAIGGMLGIPVDFVGSKVMAPINYALLRQLPPEILIELSRSGIDPTQVRGFGISVLCCGAGLVIAALLGAVGGVIFAAVKPQEATL
jgi:hypothetical protein